MIIVGAFESQRGVVDNRAHGGLQQPVGEIHVIYPGEIPLHEVGEDVGSAAGLSDREAGCR